jgi:RNA polymerase sigma-70 factor (ECF subfamily)
MPEPTANTVQLQRWLERLRAGDASARDELLRAVGTRLEQLARKMLQRFPNVQRWAETNDVLQNSMLRLLRSLEKVEPSSMRDFYNLAAGLMRSELLSLARHFARANRHEGGPLGEADLEPPAPADDAAELERWTRFHEACAGLPVEEREVVGLIFYHGWEQADVAQWFSVSVRTVQRRWQSAMVKLHHVLQDEGREP